MSRVRTGAVWVLVVGAAVGLRLWRVRWGLEGGGGWFPDEMLFSGRAAGFVPFTWAAFLAKDLGYPTLHGNLAGLALSAACATGTVDGAPHVFHPAALLAARGVATAAGLAGVLLAGLAARRAYGARAGLVAAGLLAVAPLHAMHSHIALTDVTLTAFVGAALVAALALAERGTVPLAALAGAATGAAFGTKYTGLGAAVPVGWAILESAVALRRPVRIVVLGVAAVVGFAVAAVLACPSCALRPDTMLGAMGLHRFLSGVAAPFPNNRLVPSLGWYGIRWVYELVASLPYALGWPLWALALAGVAVALVYRTRADRVLLVAAVSYFAVIGAAAAVFPRYLLPLFPALVVLAARAWARAAAWPRARAVVLAAVWTYGLALSTTQVARFEIGTRNEIAGWVAAALGQGRQVAVPVLVPGLDYVGIGGPLVRAGLGIQPRLWGEWLDGDPDAVVLSDWIATAIRRDMPGSPAASELARIESGEAGFRLARRWDAWFFDRGTYVLLDPAFAGDLWQGRLGFAVYVRER